MDILFVIILILLGSRIFSKKDRGNRNDDSGDVSSEEGPSQGSNRTKANGERTGAAMTWEDMEQKYGIKIEHDKPTMAESSRREAEKNGSATIAIEKSTLGERTPDEQIPAEADAGATVTMETKEPARPSRDVSVAQPTSAPPPTSAPKPTWSADTSGAQPTLAERLAQYKAGRSAQMAAMTPVAETLSITSRRRKSRLPAGGLKAGIMWSLILEPPKAKKRRAGGSL